MYYFVEELYTFHGGEKTTVTISKGCTEMVKKMGPRLRELSSAAWRC